MDTKKVVGPEKWEEVSEKQKTCPNLIESHKAAKNLRQPLRTSNCPGLILSLVMYSCMENAV